MPIGRNNHQFILIVYDMGNIKLRLNNDCGKKIFAYDSIKGVSR